MCMTRYMWSGRPGTWTNSQILSSRCYPSSHVHMYVYIQPIYIHFQKCSKSPQTIYTACVCAQLLSCVRLLEIQWTVAHQALLSMGFSRQEYWNELPVSPPGDLSDPGIKPMSPALQVDSLLLSHQGSPICCIDMYKYILMYPRAILQLIHIYTHTYQTKVLSFKACLYMTGFLSTGIYRYDIIPYIHNYLLLYVYTINNFRISVAT